MKPLIAAIVFVLAGCGAGNDKAMLDALQSKVESTESRLVIAEQQIKQLEGSIKQTGNWVLWKRVQNLCSACLYNAPRPISAYPTRTECIIAASKLIEPNGTLISNDPIEIQYVDRRLYFHCLPPNIDASK